MRKSSFAEQFQKEKSHRPLFYLRVNLKNNEIVFLIACLRVNKMFSHKLSKLDLYNIVDGLLYYSYVHIENTGSQRTKVFHKILCR